MERLDRKLLVWFFITLALGIGLHDLFDRWPSIVTEFIAPVNESLWEHTKLLFWPYLLAGWQLTRSGQWKPAPWLATLLLICGLMLAGGWLIHFTWQLEPALPWDILLYFLLVGLAFVLPPLLPVGERWGRPLACAVVLLGGLMLCWTIQPPNAPLFHDLSLADTIYRLPC